MQEVKGKYNRGRRWYYGCHRYLQWHQKQKEITN